MKKDYFAELNALRAQIINDICALIPSGTEKKLRDPMYVHYIFGDGCNTYTCTSVRLEDNGKLVLLLRGDIFGNGRIEGSDLDCVDTKSFYYLLAELERSVKRDMLDEIRGIVASNGGRIEFKDSHPFQFEGCNDCFSNLTALYVEDGDGEIIIESECKGAVYSNGFEDLVAIKDWQLILEYAREKKKFTVRVTGSYSRDIEVEACSKEEAIVKAQEVWKNEPLCREDCNVENLEIR